MTPAPPRQAALLALLLPLLAASLPGEALAQSAAKASTPQFSGPIVISRGGTYRGNWQSLNPDQAAVLIKTSEPVIIEDSVVQGKGTLIKSVFQGARVTIRRTKGIALNPGRPLSEYRYPGRFLHLEEFRSAVVENNELVGTSGMYFRDYRGTAERGETIKIRRNRAKNIDGRYSTGPNTFSLDRARLVQFVQFNGVQRLAGAEIAWNEVINEPGKSRPEEVISMFLSSGVPNSSILIHNNYIQGAYPARPTDGHYSGGGMNLADGGTKNPRDANAYIKAYRNVIINTGNQGIAISAGHDIQAYENRILSSGYLPDGRPIGTQGVGLYVWDLNGNRKYGTFYNNSARDNLVRWETPLRGKNSTNNWWFPDCPAVWKRNGVTVKGCTGNRTLPTRVTQSVERQEYASWLARVKAAGLRLGLDE